MLDKNKFIYTFLWFCTFYNICTYKVNGPTTDFWRNEWSLNSVLESSRGVSWTVIRFKNAIERLSNAYALETLNCLSVSVLKRVCREFAESLQTSRELFEPNIIWMPAKRSIYSAVVKRKMFSEHLTNALKTTFKCS